MSNWIDGEGHSLPTYKPNTVPANAPDNWSELTSEAKDAYFIGLSEGMRVRKNEQLERFKRGCIAKGVGFFAAILFLGGLPLSCVIATREHANPINYAVGWSLCFSVAVVVTVIVMSLYYDNGKEMYK